MPHEQAAASEVLQPWQGRRGIAHALMCFVLAVVCALALNEWATSRIAGPACSVHGHALGLSYVEVRNYGNRNDVGTVCLYRRANGDDVAVAMQDAAPFLTALWLDFALDPVFTIPAFAVLLALARTGLHRLRRRGDGALRHP